MGDQSRSTQFRALFESALQAYEKTTGIALAQHPFAVKLQSCHTVESITALVQDQVSAFSAFGGKDRITKTVNGTISIISTLSATTFLREDIGGLVCQKDADGVSTTLMAFLQSLPPAKAIHAGVALLLDVCSFFTYHASILRPSVSGSQGYRFQLRCARRFPRIDRALP